MAGLCTGDGPCDPSPTGTGANWVTKNGGLPLYIRAVAHAQKRAGMSETQAVVLAIGVIRRWAKGEGNVTPATRARAAKALAEWDALKAKSHTHSSEAAMPASSTAILLAVSAAQRKQAQAAHATLNGSLRYPTMSKAQFVKAVAMVGMSKTPATKVRSYLVARAKKMGWEDAVPKGWM
jgi:hypothetical protein